MAENVLRGQTPASMIQAMVEKGIDRAAAAREVETARTHPYLRPPPHATGQGGVPASRLAKREWVLELMRRAALQDPATATVPVVRRPSREQFLHEFYAANRPCLIEGAMDDWPAMTGWTMEKLKARFGDRRIETQAGRNTDANYEMNSDRHRKEMSFGEYIDLVTTCGRTNDFYMTANNSGKNKAALAELWDDIVLFPEYLRDDDPANRGFFWFGPAGTVTPLHHDLTNNFMAQVVGRKLVRLIARSTALRLQQPPLLLAGGPGQRRLRQVPPVPQRARDRRGAQPRPSPVPAGRLVAPRHGDGHLHHDDVHQLRLRQRFLLLVLDLREV